ncbi:S-adenosyl-L-methionine-dependent methyltransferase, partial [Gaertneriomyces semiglobifer]
ELLAAQVTPLHAMPYEEQLNTKAGLHRKALFNFKKRLLGYLPRDYLSNDKYEVNVTDQSIENLTPEVRSLIQLSWLKPALEANNKIPCPLLAPVASPDVDEYRTKVEYSFGWNQNGEIAVGFLSGLFKEGQVSIVNPQHTKHVSAAAKAIANALQGFLRAGGGGLDVYDRVAKKGFWRMALVRTPLTGENMVAVQFDRSKVPPALVDEALKALQDHLQGSVDRGDCKIATLLVTECDGVFNGIKNDAKMKVLWGTGYIHEELLGLKFRVSPTAFFQVNTKAAEVLYSKVREWSLNLSKTPGTIVLDLCCGTGTIGLALHPAAKHVIGCDITASAIEDANFNAKLNNADNVTFVAQRVEHCIKHMLANVGEHDDVVAVLDPPRAVFVACDAEQSLGNLVDLCRPTANKFKGKPFIPLRAQTVDLFPHTSLSEMIVELRR